MKVLLIDDSPYDRALIKHHVGITWPDTEWTEVINRRSWEQALEQASIFDLVLTDYQIKWTTGLEILRTMYELHADIPIIMVTDTGSEEIAVEAMKTGLYDYVLKTHLSRLSVTIRESLEKRQLRAQQAILEQQVQQAQKMESLGLLVSGMAHDFNNLLASIIGYAQQGQKHCDSPQDSETYFKHIYSRADQGARMTRQLLTFARGNQLAPGLIEINPLITNLQNLIGTLLGPDIILEFDPGPDVPIIYADPTQLEQILMNLCVNARDAMPQGGKLRIKTQTTTIKQNRSDAIDGIEPGSYVQITVADTGIGMSPEVQARLFEPFFTTKEVGRGTGLGLAVVYGIMRQHHGFIEVESTPGKGTCFSLYLPQMDILGEQTVEEQPEEKAPRVLSTNNGQTTILVVEDDPDIQIVIDEVLREEGYHVLMADNGEEGLKLLYEHADAIRLIIADVMMPRMQGRAFQEHVRRIYPQMKMLVMSGYQSAQLQQRNLIDPHSTFLQKPFDLEYFVDKVQELLAEAV